MRLRAPLLVLLAGMLLAGATDEMKQGEDAFDRGDLAGALVHWSVALADARARDDAGGTFEVAIRLAAAHRELGQYQEARRALIAADETINGIPQRAADADLAWGQLLFATGDLPGAEGRLRDAFRGYQENKDPQGAANAAVATGICALDEHRYADAERAFDAADTLFAALGDDAGRADALVNAGIARRRQGALAEAQTRFEAAAATFRQLDDPIGEADALANLALVLEDTGDVAAARGMLLDALDRARARKDVARQGALLQDLGALEHRAGNLERATAAYADAETAYTSLGMRGEALSVRLDKVLAGRPIAGDLVSIAEEARRIGDRRLEATALLDAAVIYRQSRRPTEAGKALARARDLATLIEDAELQWRIDALDGRIRFDAGDTAGGIASLEKAVDALEEHRGGLDAAATRGFLQDHRDVYRSLIDALVTSGDPRKAMVYADRLQLANLPDPAQPPEVEQLDAQKDWVEGQLTAELEALPEGAQETERITALREQLAALRIDFARTVDEMRAQHADFDSRVRVDPADLEAIQADLPADVAVLVPILFDDRIVLLVFRRDRLVARTVAAPGTDVRAAVVALAHAMQGGDTFHPQETLAACDQLGKWLLAPIEKDLEGTDTLVVAADGAFRQLPFAALRSRGRFLVEDRAVVSITHVGSLREEALGEPFHIGQSDLLLLGDPDGTLPGADAEVHAIAARFPGAEVLVGRDASRKRLLEGSSSHRALHLATHGILDPERPDRSWLLLAPTADDDGRLTYSQIPGLQPWLGDVRMVVLSACESGLPVNAVAPPSGQVIVSIDGLASQFRRAGVETLVASLWRVDDAGTLRLMDGFYGGLADGQDVAESLREAQVRMIAEDEWKHPWYWAGFVVVGDWT